MASQNQAGSKPKRKPMSERQRAFLKRRLELEQRKAERRSRERLDAWHLQTFYPDKAKARRLKGTKNNKVASAWRSQMFIERFEAWPPVLTAKEMSALITAYLSPKKVGLSEEERRLRVGDGHKSKWQGAAKHFPKEEASVRKKLTKLGVYRFNFPLGLWFKCGSAEEALEEAKRQEAERDAWRLEQEARRLDREEQERREQEERQAKWRAEQEAKKEAERLAELSRRQAEALATRPIDCASLSPEEADLLLWDAKCWCPSDGLQSLADLRPPMLRMVNRHGLPKWIESARRSSEIYKERLAFAVLVGD